MFFYLRRNSLIQGNHRYRTFSGVRGSLVIPGQIKGLDLVRKLALPVSAAGRNYTFRQISQIVRIICVFQFRTRHLTAHIICGKSFKQQSHGISVGRYMMCSGQNISMFLSILHKGNSQKPALRKIKGPVKRMNHGLQRIPVHPLFHFNTVKFTAAGTHRLNRLCINHRIFRP